MDGFYLEIPTYRGLMTLCCGIFPSTSSRVFIALVILSVLSICHSILAVVSFEDIPNEYGKTVNRYYEFMSYYIPSFRRIATLLELWIVYIIIHGMMLFIYYFWKAIEYSFVVIRKFGVDNPSLLIGSKFSRLFCFDFQ